MDRRTFLARLGFGTVSAAAAALTFDVDKLLWVPGEKTMVHLSTNPLPFDSLLGDPVFVQQLIRANLTLFRPTTPYLEVLPWQLFRSTDWYADAR
jgi:hypothetical protein